MAFDSWQKVRCNQIQTRSKKHIYQKEKKAMAIMHVDMRYNELCWLSLSYISHIPNPPGACYAVRSES